MLNHLMGIARLTRTSSDSEILAEFLDFTFWKFLDFIHTETPYHEVTHTEQWLRNPLKISAKVGCMPSELFPSCTNVQIEAGSTDSKSTAKKARTAKSAAQPRVPEAKKEAVPEEVDEIQLEESDSPEDASEDDQTAALLKGFESSSESGDEDEQAQDDDAPTLDISTLPDPIAALEKSKAKPVISKAIPSGASGPTVIYISRVPHGFYEAQMKAYFSQFGDIRHLRLARNRRTGASKHYAFVEFHLPEVARIVQQTMDNYLMFKHILKVRLVPNEQVHPELWKGAGKRFRKVPWNRIERTRVAATDRDGWTKRTKREEERREAKRQKLEALGYSFRAPELREVNTVPKHVVEAAGAVAAATEDSEKEPVKLLEEAPTGETFIEKITKNSKSGKQTLEVEQIVKSKDGSKSKKRNKKTVAV